MAADDVQLGHVVDLTLGEPSGTELVAAAAIGATSLVVDYAGDFEDVGDLTLNGAALTYTSIAYGDAETDPDTIELAAPLAAAAATDDKVARMAGGELVTDWTLHVSLGDGHPVDIPIPFEQRAMWSSADVSTPIPVFVSADLERLVEVPGRVPTLDQAVIDVPFVTLYQAANVLRSSSTTYATMNDWTMLKQSGIDYDPTTGKVTFLYEGHYAIGVAVTWAGASSGARKIQLVSTVGGVDTTVRETPGAPPDATQYAQQITKLDYEPVVGEEMRVQSQQNSGASLDLRGDAAGRLTVFEIVRLHA